jgi:hypothetical protein
MWTASSLSYKPWIWHGEMQRSVLLGNPVFTTSPRNARCGARGGEAWRGGGKGGAARHGESIAHYCCVIAIRDFGTSTVLAWSKYATIYIFQSCCVYGVFVSDLKDGFWIEWLDLLISYTNNLGLQTIQRYRCFHTLHCTVTYALGFSAIISRILATYLYQSVASSHT